MSILPSRILKIGFGIFLCILAVIELVKVFKKDKKKGKKKQNK